MSQVGQLVAIVVGILGAASGTVATLVMVLNYRQQRARAELEQDSQELLNNAAVQLASTVRKQWRDEENRRRINDPFPLPLRWVNAPDELVDHWSNILMLKRAVASKPLDLSGTIDSVNEIFDRVPSKRIVVLGEAGAGKTILVLRYTLGVLDRRMDNGRGPIPVILGMASWDPGKLSLREWLVQRLTDEYPGLSAAVPSGATLAAALIDRELIIPVLDGFDELPEKLRPAALIALNATMSPMVITSRPIEYQVAVGSPDGDVLSAAAAVSLTDLTIGDLTDYLPRTTRKLTQSHRAVTKWDPVLAQLSHYPDDPQSITVKDVLSTPLMVGLARAIYSDTRDSDPKELLHSGRFSAVKELEDHLLDAFIPAAYHHGAERPRKRKAENFSADNALLWLGNIAVDLDKLGTRDLEWWRLRDTVSTHARLLVSASVAAIGAGVLLGVVWKFGVGLGLGFGVGVGLVRVGRPPIRVRSRIRGREGEFIASVSGGIVGGITGALIGELALELAGSTHGLILGPLARNANGTASNSAAAITIGIAAGFVLSTMSWAGIRRTSSSPSPAGKQFPRWITLSMVTCVTCLVGGILGSIFLGLSGGLTLGIAFGISMGSITGLEAPLDIEAAASPIRLLQTDRRNSIITGVLLGLALGLAVLIATWPTIGPLRALALALGSCLMQVIAISIAFTAWGHWVIFARGWLPLTGRLPFALPEFIADAHQRGVLRQAGAAYQFRHARLQQRLSTQRRGKAG